MCSEGLVAASDVLFMVDYCSVTASDASLIGLINPFTDYEYDSELEVSGTQFETLETGEISHEDESVSALADRVLTIHVAQAYVKVIRNAYP